MIRTRPGNVIDLVRIRSHSKSMGSICPLAGMVCAGEGSLCQVASDLRLLEARFDSESWIAEGRTTWLTVEPARITGRRLVAATLP